MTSLDSKVDALDSRVNELGMQMATMVGSMSHMANSVSQLSVDLRDWSHVSSNRLRSIETDIASMKAVDEERQKQQDKTTTRVMMYCALFAFVPTAVTLWVQSHGKV